MRLTIIEIAWSLSLPLATSIVQSDGLMVGFDLSLSQDLASRMNTRRELAQKMAYCLREARMIELIGKRGRANLYRVPSDGEAHKRHKQTLPDPGWLRASHKRPPI